jgi:hypothetical protein
LAGEYLEAQFKGRSINDVMEIPRNAIFNSNEVFVINQGRLKIMPVNIVKLNERTLLFNGLNMGDTVVVQSLIGVMEGLPALMIGSAKANAMMKAKGGKSDKIPANKKERKTDS